MMNIMVRTLIVKRNGRILDGEEVLIVQKFTAKDNRNFINKSGDEKYLKR